jgi:hypothetical protein
MVYGYWKIFFLNISNNIELSFPCVKRHLELIIKTYLNFDKAYLLYPEEILCVYGLDKDVDSCADTKLKQFPPNPYQRQQVEKLINYYKKRHSFVTKKDRKDKKKIYLKIKGKIKYSREISEDSSDGNDFTFSPGIVENDND